ncbi:hypothetical protein MPNT_360001 [Candidatus Methylacidithermus pantelleriae]|uniref:Uncharacterized protein n=1 Tax=Candidatus Methylacidithermus pantelleriae TaxID=2744239 RepID=A0A8J2FSR4_9BACT|nr:hypothetical protein MPNT_360001 [Candidatus Methylacidithermus pantelleriae]
MCKRLDWSVNSKFIHCCTTQSQEGYRGSSVVLFLPRATLQPFVVVHGINPEARIKT